MSNDPLQREFLYNSIQDIVSTIRAIDTKLHIVLGVYLIPLVLLDKLLNAFSYWCSIWDGGILQTITSGVAVASAFIWLLGAVESLRGITALANPVNAVLSSNDSPSGVFYYVGELRGRRSLKLDRKLEEQISKLPMEGGAILRELTFEQMKLGFIRDIKMRRHRISALLAIAWGLLAIAAVIMYHFAIQS